MGTRILSGNEALAFGALMAGTKVITGYPGTPSTGVIDSLLKMNLPDRHVEWSTNEKVAFEIATGAAWAGHRALCTMKMSGLNVAYDSLISVAYSGCNGALVVYVADDPGASAGMAEQDSRGFAMISDLPLIEPCSVAETYRLIQQAFELSEKAGLPVLFRMVTSVALSRASVEVEEPLPPPEREVILERDIERYTKAGAAISMTQHRLLIERLEKAGKFISKKGLNSLEVGKGSLKKGARKDKGFNRLGIIASGVVVSYLDEGLGAAERFGLDRNKVSVLRLSAPHPFPAREVRSLIRHSDVVLVLEELEPHIERSVYIEAKKIGFSGKILGKLDGNFSRIGEYGLSEAIYGIGSALDLKFPEELFRKEVTSERLIARRYITVCAGCPHRGTFMAINRALKKLKLSRKEVMVTGDIGCTILGMNPPFETVWNEISMGASIGLAQGYVQSGIRSPVIATMGDSTFFHAGIPGLLNAVQHQVPLTLIIMDNGWTAMTGMQSNPGTAESFQKEGSFRVDIARIIPAFGIEHFFVMDPFDLDGSVDIMKNCLTLPGVKVVLSRQECAVQAQRRGRKVGEIRVLSEKCNLCKQCIAVTGCPALSIDEESVKIATALCYGCGLCSQVCSQKALVKG